MFITYILYDNYLYMYVILNEKDKFDFFYKNCDVKSNVRYKQKR